jgi:rhodanese-related sulfurtransferase
MKNFNPDRVARMVVCRNSNWTGPQQLFFLMTFVLVASLIIPPADAQCCSIGNWETTARAFLDSDDVPGVPAILSNQQARSPVVGVQELENRRDSFLNGNILLPLKSVASSYVVVDVSSSDDYNRSHIQNALHIPAKRFLNANGSIKPYDELAKILADAGISEHDPVVVYRSSGSSGESEFAFLILSHLGHENARVLDGSLKDWVTAGLPIKSSANKKPTAIYNSDIRPRVSS